MSSSSPLAIGSERLKTAYMRPLFTLLFLLATQAILAQSGSNTKTPDPAFLNQVYCYRGDTLTALGRTDGRMENKMKALGFGGSQMGYSMDGARSAVRIKKTDSLRFVVKLAGNMMDPSMMLQLYRFDPKKSNRIALISSHSRFGGDEDIKNVIRLDIQKGGTDVYILIPAEKLTPGEYGFMNKMALNQSGTTVTYTFYDFGIDP